MSEAPIVVKEVQQGLTSLQQRAEAIVVRDADSCREAKIMQRDVRDYMKDVHRKLDPFVDSASYFELAVFLMDYRGGQYSRGYRLLSRLAPPNFSSVLCDEMRESEMYQYLVANYAKSV